MPEKRPYPENGLENGSSKKSRSNDGSPAPAMTDDERKKAEIAEKVAAMKARIAAQRAAPATTPAVPQPSSLREDAMAKVAAMKARLAARSSAPSPSPAPQSAAPAAQPPSTTSSSSALPADVQARIAAIKARAQQQSRSQSPQVATQREDTTSRARGGLGIGLHPALLGDLPKTRDQEHETKRKQPAKVNPYLTQEAQAEDDRIDAAAFDPRLGKGGVERKSRAMIFNQKGKFIAQAEALREAERIEKINQEMQAEARKKAIEEATERSYLVKPPPEIEWWDEAFVNGKSYDAINQPGGLKFDAITEYVQHPVLLDPPQEKLLHVAKPMYLTKKEQAKLRRQQRMEAHKEEQTKIRLGLIPPPPPKVKKSNLMRVLGEEAVKDPTAVEARVNREIAARQEKHEMENESRMLTKEQRHEKLAAQQDADAQKGLRVAVFRVDSLCNGQHRYKVDINAKQNKLTGSIILHPKMCLIVVEGGAHSVNAYKKLMINRVKWAENVAPLGEPQRASRYEDDKDWLQPLGEDGRLKDLSENRCVLVWEGDEKARAFRKWTTKVCETDGEAKDALARMKMENMWTLAQTMQLD